MCLFLPLPPLVFIVFLHVRVFPEKYNNIEIVNMYLIKDSHPITIFLSECLGHRQILFMSLIVQIPRGDTAIIITVLYYY